MMNTVNIKNHPDLIRDIDSGAILNTNRGEYENYLLKKQRKKQQQMLLDDQAQMIHNLSNEVNELKSLVKLLLEKNSTEQNSSGSNK